MIRVMVLRPGQPPVVELTEPTLAGLQKVVGGSIQTVPDAGLNGDGLISYCDEDGESKDLAPSFVAPDGQLVRGTIVVAFQKADAVLEDMPPRLALSALEVLAQGTLGPGLVVMLRDWPRDPRPDEIAKMLLDSVTAPLPPMDPSTFTAACNDIPADVPDFPTPAKGKRSFSIVKSRDPKKDPHNARHQLRAMRQQGRTRARGGRRGP